MTKVILKEVHPLKLILSAACATIHAIYGIYMYHIPLGSRPSSGDVRGQTPPAYLQPIDTPSSPTKKKKKKKKKQQEELPPPQAHGWGARPPGPALPSTHAAQPPPLQGRAYSH